MTTQATIPDDRFRPAAPAAASRLRQALLLAVALLLVVLYRRPDQFSAPYIWAEDGVVNIPDFLASGWSSVLHPIAGYFSVPIKLINALAMQLSLRWFPEISFVLTLLASYGVLAAVAFSPTRLRWPLLCALVILFIPTESEVFGVALLIGWWTSLLALLPLYWNEEGRRPLLRLFLLAVGGLSSPLIVGIAPLYVLRAAVTRRRDDIVTTLAALMLAALQYQSISRANIVRDAGVSIKLDLIVEKFFGYYLAVGNNFVQSGLAMYLGLALIAFIVASWIAHRRELGLTFVLLGGSLGAAIASAVLRMPLEVINPAFAAARYFFFAYVVIGWIIVQLASLDKAGLRLASCALLAVAARNGLENGRRLHAHLDWRAQIDSCLHSPAAYSIPIHTFGGLDQAWHVDLTAAQCRTLLSRSLFDGEPAP
ncbi:MAG TPA: hypothetical protein VM847_15100 [Tahibacter sp.]|jgi:hypothetical protein|nr:hypothetical protein [Tahibacter sp.]